MAEKKISHSDLFEADLTGKAIADLEKLLPVIEKIKKGFVSIAPSIKEGLRGGMPTDTAGIEKHNKAVKDSAGIAEGLRLANEKLAKVEAQLAAERKKQTAEGIKEKLILQESLKLKKAEAQENISAIGSIERLRASNARLNIERNKVNLNTAEGRKRLKELNDQLDSNNKKIKENVDAYAKQKINIGNYKEAITGALNESSQFRDVLSKLTIIQDILKKAFGGTINEIKSLILFTKAETVAEESNTLATEANIVATEEQIVVTNLQTTAVEKQTVAQRLMNSVTGKGTVLVKLFNTAVKASLIGAIIAVIGGLTAFFKKFDEGQDTIEKFFAQTGAFFTVFINRIALMGESISKAFSAFSDFDFKKGFKALGDATDAFDGMGKAISDAVKKTGELIEAQDRFQQAIRKSKIAIAVLNVEQEIQNKLASDATLGFNRRELAERKLSAIGKERLELELSIAKKEFEFAKEKLRIEAEGSGMSKERFEQLLKEQKASGVLTDDKLNDLVEIQARTIEAEGAIEKFKEEVAEKSRERRNKELLNNLKIVEELADLSLNANKKIAADTEETFEKRIDAVENFGQVSSEAFEKEIKAIEDFTNKKVDGDSLVNAQNSVELEERIRGVGLGVKAEAQLLDAIGRRKKEIEALADLEKKINDDKKKSDDDKAKAEIKRQADLQKLFEDETEKNKIREKELRDKEIEENFKTINTINKAVQDGLDKRGQKRQEAIEKEQDANEDAISRQEELASKGLDNQLAFEEAKKAKLQAKLEREKVKEQQREEAAQLASAFLELLKSYAKDGKTGANASARAFGDVLIAKGISKAIAGGLYEGTEEVGEEHSVMDLGTAKDNLLVRLHPKERVVNAEDNLKLKGMTNEDLVRAGQLYKSGLMIPEVADMSKKESVEYAMNKILIKKIDQLNTTLKNKKEYSVNWDEHGARVETVVEAGMTKVLKKVITGKARI